MTPFELLTNQTRQNRRPPRMVPGVTIEQIARLVPVRILPTRAAQAPNLPIPVSTTKARSNLGRKSPLAQIPLNMMHFSSVPNQHFRSPVNGNNRTALNIESAEASEVIEKIPEKITENLQRVHPEDLSSEVQPDIFNPKPCLREILEHNSDLPSQSFILGVCEDELPLALDINDPTPGALLAIGDIREEQIGLLRTAIASACLRNSPRAVQFLVFSHQPESWRAWVSGSGFDRHCIAIVNAQEDALEEWILQLADWAEQRRIGQRNGPPILIAIDALAFLPRLAYDIRLNFDWLVKEGSQAKIWTFAAISTELAVSLGNRMLRSFKSRILGCAKDTGIYSRLVGLDKEQAGRFGRPGIFAVEVGDRWLNFHLPGNEKSINL